MDFRRVGQKTVEETSLHPSSKFASVVSICNSDHLLKLDINCNTDHHQSADSSELSSAIEDNPEASEIFKLPIRNMPAAVEEVISNMELAAKEQLRKEIGVRRVSDEIIQI